MSDFPEIHGRGPFDESFFPREAPPVPLKEEPIKPAAIEKNTNHQLAVLIKLMGHEEKIDQEVARLMQQILDELPPDFENQLDDEVKLKQIINEIQQKIKANPTLLGRIKSALNHISTADTAVVASAKGVKLADYLDKQLHLEAVEDSLISPFVTALANGMKAFYHTKKELKTALQNQQALLLQKLDQPDLPEEERKNLNETLSQIQKDLHSIEEKSAEKIREIAYFTTMSSLAAVRGAAQVSIETGSDFPLLLTEYGIHVSTVAAASLGISSLLSLITNGKELISAIRLQQALQKEIDLLQLQHKDALATSQTAIKGSPAHTKSQLIELRLALLQQKAKENRAGIALKSLRLGSSALTGYSATKTVAASLLTAGGGKSTATALATTGALTASVIHVTLPTLLLATIPILSYLEWKGKGPLSKMEKRSLEKVANDLEELKEINQSVIQGLDIEIGPIEPQREALESVRDQLNTLRTEVYHQFMELDKQLPTDWTPPPEGPTDQPTKEEIQYMENIQKFQECSLLKHCLEEVQDAYLEVERSLKNLDQLELKRAQTESSLEHPKRAAIHLQETIRKESLAIQSRDLEKFVSKNVAGMNIQRVMDILNSFTIKATERNIGSLEIVEITDMRNAPQKQLELLTILSQV